MDFELPDEIRLIRESVRRFVQEELLPLEQSLPESYELPRDVRRTGAVRAMQRELRRGAQLLSSGAERDAGARSAALQQREHQYADAG